MTVTLSKQRLEEMRQSRLLIYGLLGVVHCLIYTYFRTQLFFDLPDVLLRIFWSAPILAAPLFSSMWVVDALLLKCSWKQILVTTGKFVLISALLSECAIGAQDAFTAAKYGKPKASIKVDRWFFFGHAIVCDPKVG